MVAASRNKIDEGGVDGYYCPKPVTFEKKYKTFISNSKTLDFVSYVQKQKKDLPSPDKYETMLNLLDKTKRFPLYRTDRKTYCDIIKKESKRAPGVGTYETKGLAVKVKGNFKSNLERVSITDEAKANSLLVPAPYKEIDLKIIKRRNEAWKIRAETDKEKEMQKEAVKRREGPSPASYKTEPCVTYVKEKSPMYKISKTEHKKFSDYYAAKKKFVPGVGAYKLEKVEDHISKPMRKY